MKWIAVALLALAAGALPPQPTSPTEGTAEGTAEVAQFDVEVLATHPHDPEAFTQGLELHDGLLYESTGQYGRSDVRVTEVETGGVVRSQPLADEHFAEGLTLVGDDVWQLTWQAGVALRRDVDSLAERDRVSYQGEGWGLCYDQSAERLVMSDGSAELTFRDPDTFAVLDTVTVRAEGRPRDMLNELECVDGAVWANVWQTDHIVRINPDSGAVEAVVDASGLLSADERAFTDVLNGIAAVPGTDTFLITGKLWPWLYEVRFVPVG